MNANSIHSDNYYNPIYQWCYIFSGEYINGTKLCGNEIPSNQTFINVGALQFISDGIGQYQGFSVYVDFLGMSIWVQMCYEALQ